MVTPAVKREAVAHLRSLLGLSERRACRIAGADRKMVRYQAQRAPDTELRGRLRELANDFHTYYNAHQFLVADERLRDARVKLILAVRQVLRNGLNLLGVSAPESM